MSGIGITDNSGDINGLAINTDGEAKVALTLAVEKSGFTTTASEKGILPNGDRVMRELEASDDYQLRIGLDNIWIADYPIGTVVNTKKWFTFLTASQTITVGGARYELNSSGLTTANSGSLLRSQKYIPFYKANAAYVEFAVNWTLDPVANWFAEWGFGSPASAIAAQTDGVFFRITAGQFRGVSVNNSVETYIDLGTLPTVSVVHNFVIEAAQDVVYFWHEDNLLGKLNVPNTQFGPTSQSSLPVFMRTYTAAIAPASAIKLQVSAIAASNGGADTSRLWPTVQVGMGNSAIQAPTGTAVGQTANYVNSTVPVSATLANITAGYATLGGQFQFAAPAGAETDYALFAYQVPTGYTLMVRDIWIDTMNTGAAVATSVTWLQWAVGVGSNLVTLANADGATAKAPSRIALGNQVFPIAAAIGAQAVIIDKNFDVPLCVNSGEFLHIMFKAPLGTATASQIIRGIVGVNAYFE